MKRQCPRCFRGTNKMTCPHCDAPTYDRFPKIEEGPVPMGRLFHNPEEDSKHTQIQVANQVANMEEVPVPMGSIFHGDMD